MAEFSPTEEQIHAIKTAHSGETFVVDAVAGSGKTSTARRMCQALKGRVLYLVYNSAAAKEAKDSFPSNTRVSTTSALAWEKYKDSYGDRILGPLVPGSRYARQGSPRVPARETARLAGLKPVNLGNNTPKISEVTLAWLATDTIQKFCYSDDDKISEIHVPALPPVLDPLQIEVLRSEVTAAARKIWMDSLAVESKHRFSFDHIFKMLVATKPDLGYDTIVVDEAQDSNWATLSLLKAQANSQIIVVGDPAQQLYAWRGASDIMGEFDGPRLSLSKSFRFGESIADEADKWLAHTDTNIRVTGNENMKSLVTEGGVKNPQGVLCRTNATVMVQAMHYLEHGQRVAVCGGTKALESLAAAASKLMSGEPTDHPELSAFKDWGELMAYTDEPGGGDLKSLVHLINEYKVPGIIQACKELKDEHRGNPDVVVSTGHKAKGREWDTVVVAEDFKEPKEEENPRTGETYPGKIDHHSAMLHYVVVTRARRHLDRTGLSWIDRYQNNPREKGE